MIYPWYETLDNSEELLQGDLVPECPIITPPKVLVSNGDYKLEVALIDSIVLSQSCDLVSSKIEMVIVCPYVTLDEYLNGSPENQKKGAWQKQIIDRLKKGHMPGQHILNKFPAEGINECFVVDFKNVYGINLGVLKAHAIKLGGRKRLLSPYREHLSQAFARYFMRVGLPTVIDV